MQVYLRGLRGQCPYCGRGQMAKGLFQTHDRCSHCGLVFQDKPGDFTGASVLSYGITSLIALAIAMALVILTELPTLLIGGIGIGLIVLISVITYQPLKGLWIAFLVQNDSLQPPPDHY